MRERENVDFAKESVAREKKWGYIWIARENFGCNAMGKNVRKLGREWVDRCAPMRTENAKLMQLLRGEKPEIVSESHDGNGKKQETLEK